MDMNQYVIVDLEMCKVPLVKRTEQFSCSKEIIEIGAVLINEKLEIADTFKTYVAPEYGTLDDYIRNLTGIKNSDIENAPVFHKALEQFVKWLPDNAIIVSWSDNDERQISKEMYCKSIEIPEFEKYLDNWEDCQEEFSERMNTSKLYRLSEALIITDLEYDESFHDALVDAKNTALLFAKMKKETELQLSSYYVVESCSDTFTYKPFASMQIKCNCV